MSGAVRVGKGVVVADAFVAELLEEEFHEEDETKRGEAAALLATALGREEIRVAVGGANAALDAARTEVGRGSLWGLGPRRLAHRVRGVAA